MSSPIYPQYYYSTGGDNAGIYIDPVTGTAVDSRNRCNTTLQIPCDFTLNNQYINLVVSDSPCIFNWCTLINSIKSMAGSSLISADAADSGFALTGSYATADTQKAIALKNAELILNY